MNETTAELIRKTIVRLESVLDVNEELGDLEKESIRVAVIHLKNSCAISQVDEVSFYVKSI